MAKYTIKLKKNVKYPDVSSTIDMDNDHIFSNEKLLNVIETQIVNDYLQHPLFDERGDANETKLKNLKKNARYIVSFPCEAGKNLDKDVYGQLAITFDGPKKNCSENGTYSYSASLKDNIVTFLPDPFVGSKDSTLKPNLTFRFEEISKKQFNILYNLSMKIELEIKCKNNIEIIELDAFIKEPGRRNVGALISVPYTDKTATFLVSKDDKSTKVHTMYQYGISEETILTRVLSPYSENNRYRKKIYDWVPIAGKKPIPTLLMEDYTTFEPLTIEEFELISFDEDGKAVIPKHSYPDIGDADAEFDNPLKNRLNNLIHQFLHVRIKQLQHTLRNEIEGNYEGNNKETVIELLDKCDTKIEVSGFNITNINFDFDFKGLYIGQPKSFDLGSGLTEYEYVFIKTEQDILDLITLEDLK